MDRRAARVPRRGRGLRPIGVLHDEVLVQAGQSGRGGEAHAHRYVRAVAHALRPRPLRRRARPPGGQERHQRLHGGGQHRRVPLLRQRRGRGAAAPGLVATELRCGRRLYRRRGRQTIGHPGRGLARHRRRSGVGEVVQRPPRLRGLGPAVAWRGCRGRRAGQRRLGRRSDIGPVAEGAPRHRHRPGRVGEDRGVAAGRLEDCARGRAAWVRAGCLHEQGVAGAGQLRRGPRRGGPRRARVVVERR
mmetsp:Transcript_52991/g.152671  ORF Transcript_52991/g.152671 Transcript_52991/m.152671 type:complete len:246 (+) Transcript_52991:3-740(+)